MATFVLFLDDSPLARAVAERELESRGVAVRAIATSVEASEIDPGELSAAILDIELADGDGPAVAERLRATSPDLPIAFLTASTSSPLLDSARRIGPVFSKAGGVDEALRWVVDSLAPRPT